MELILIMLNKDQKIAIYAEGSMGTLFAKMAEGVIRYSPNPITCVIDSSKAGKSVSEVCNIDKDIPILENIDEALKFGAEVLLLGTAPSGGRLPESWIQIIGQSIEKGLSVVNGLHDSVNDIFSYKLGPNQWIWDIRNPINNKPRIGAARASFLSNQRILMIGTDMAVGKMTTGLELTNSLKAKAKDAVFLATGQTGICISGNGIPLDAYKVDYASGAVEEMVLKYKNSEYLIIEGQGSLLNPGSTATLPLMRGSCPTALVLCHRLGLRVVESETKILIPRLEQVISLIEQLVTGLNSFPTAKVIAVASTQEKRDFLLSYGANFSISPEKGFKDYVKELTNNKGADVIYDPVGGDVFDESIRCIAWNGRFLVIGFASGRIPSVPANMPLIKGFSVIGVRGTLANRFKNTEISGKFFGKTGTLSNVFALLVKCSNGPKGVSNDPKVSL